MRFTKLRLLGFKSFVEPSEFVIEAGLTGVVGPNGCGKSNLVEAIRWVMGENSYKNMRASGMDDVIFSGSGHRPARNTAEVGLYLDNTDRTAPAGFNDHDEIQVTRRIERESGSVYRINGKEARAKDVQLLFADASTGARSPSMVGQGRIGELIQAKPQARRQLLEEAAGISGLHSRRHEAELRLRAAETNLERLDDVTSELQSQIDSLKRQARQANRFRALSADIRQGEAVLLHLRWVLDKAAESEASSALAEATSGVAEKAQAQMEAAKAQAVGAHKLPELRDGSARAGAAVQRLEIARDQLDEEADRMARRRTELERRLEQLSRDLVREEQLVADNAESLERLGAEEADLRDLVAEGDGLAETLQASLVAATTKLAASEEAFQALTAERAEAAADRGQWERTLRDAREQETRLSARVERAVSERADIDARIAGLPDPAEKRLMMEAAALEVEKVVERVAACEQALDAAREDEAASRQPVEAAKAALNAIETETRTINRMLNAGAGNSPYPPVVEKIRVDRGFETALGAALGDDLEQPSDPAAPAYWRAIDTSVDDPPLPAGVSAMADHVAAPAELSRRLAQIGVVEAQQAEALQPALRPGQRLVTREGALWRWDGFVAGADAPSAAALRLEQKNRLAELDGEAVEQTKAVRTAEADLETARGVIMRTTEALKQARETHRLAVQALETARRELDAAERAQGDLSSRRAVALEAETQSAQSRDEMRQKAAEAEAALTAAKDVTALDERLARLSGEVAADRTALGEVRARHEGLKRESEARERRLEAIGRERENWLTRAKNADGHIAELRARHAETGREVAGLAEAPDEILARRRALMSELSAAEKAARDAGDRLAEAEERQRRLDTLAVDALAALSQSREARGRIEERLHAARERRSEIEERIRETLHCAPHEAIRQTGLAHDQPLPDAGAVDRQLERLKIERERLGAVNLRAEEESRDLSTRLNEIVTEREDVVEAIRKLRGAIQSLNREGRERLIAAFDVVNSEFQRLFTHLFGGGTAELQFIESDDPLEAGLEILARPPGKKPQTMTLLSGGEQALTAMALIFAVFLTNPAPICVLDEVDAPLDDHNVERFCNLMDEMAASTKTRFILITHNPITMARMNRLFGVTMAEQGVSQLVSVDLQTAEQIREAG
ncbi:chromosome segregation protein SMC [Pararhizobium haloflavum]|uniref:chromosome segregation protein SMC n=1 Tax=Pararhizobium haloflavum TaxID=2037914 RepID=UPI000C1913F7|nr:chromosome segregation protein SMC [Pararhizobium haloflavum]